MLTTAELVEIRREVKRRHPSGVTNGVNLGAEYDPEEKRFQATLDAYKRATGTPFPTCADVLAVLKALGYKDTAFEQEAAAVQEAMERRRHERNRCSVCGRTG